MKATNQRSVVYFFGLILLTLLMVSTYFQAWPIIGTETNFNNRKLKSEIKKKRYNENMNRKDPDEIQYAAFGTSVTWGSRIKGDRNKLTYIKLLSPDAHNLAIRATGPGYPGACTYTMIGDHHFDVIILEFFDYAKDGLSVITRRLRERFPDAIIIFLREWFPLAIRKSDGERVIDWALKQGFTWLDAHNKELHKAFLESDDKWFWPPRYYKKVQEEIQDKLAEEYGAYILEMERPDDPKDWINYAHLIADDFHHKSNIGHADVARRIQNLVDRVGVPAHPKVLDWPRKDFCDTWFESGIINKIKKSPEWKLSRFSDQRKYALELYNKVGSIEVTNPSKEPMKLYLSYMIISPPPSDYPVYSVTINKSDDDPVFLDQVGPSYYENRNVHVHLMKMVGMISPGNSVLIFNRETRGEKKLPFRLVSVAITNDQLAHTPGHPVKIGPIEPKA